MQWRRSLRQGHCLPSWLKDKQDFADFDRPKYSLGCFQDNQVDDNRMFKEHSLIDDKLTSLQCISYCKAKGFAYATTQWYVHCYCGTTDEFGPFQNKLLPTDICNTLCGGSSDMCGGPLPIQSMLLIKLWYKNQQIHPPETLYHQSFVPL
jgi:hypothetical protein